MIRILPTFLLESQGFSSANNYINTFRYFFRAVSTTPKFDIRYFTKKHEWVDVTADVGTVGISHYAQESLGEIVYVQLPEVGDIVDASKECGVVESVKSASELYTPVSGKVSSVNISLADNPGLINSDCYGNGWLFKLTITNPKEIEGLLDEKHYKKFLETAKHDH